MFCVRLHISVNNDNTCQKVMDQFHLEKLIYCKIMNECDVDVMSPTKLQHKDNCAVNKIITNSPISVNSWYYDYHDNTGYRDILPTIIIAWNLWYWHIPKP